MASITVTKMKNITLNDLCKNFDCTLEQFSQRFIDFYNSVDFTYSHLSSEERDATILEILNKLYTDQQVIGAPERTDVWHKGWKENLDGFLENKNIDEIVPKFIRPNKIVRYNGDFIKPTNGFFERDFAKLIQIFCYDNFIKETDVDSVYEFGCGSSFNLMSLIDLNNSHKNLNFYGSDFVQSSVDLCNALGAHYDVNLSGFRFNMIEPDTSLVLDENSAVFTFGAIEQLRSKFHNFIDLIVASKPTICFHIEPTVENYNPESLFDHLQIRFHQKRGYTEGLLPYLRELEHSGKVQIVKDKRLNFGSLFMEGYHLYAWKPV